MIVRRKRGSYDGRIWNSPVAEFRQVLGPGIMTSIDLDLQVWCQEERRPMQWIVAIDNKPIRNGEYFSALVDRMVWMFWVSMEMTYVCCLELVRNNVRVRALC